MKVLIVDDENLAISRLTRLLNDLKVDDITSFDDGNEALIQCTKTKFDVVFLDISMPSINGLELANKILDIEPKTFVVFQTAYDKYALEAFKSGGMGYLLKPIDKNNLNEILLKAQNYIEKSSQTETKKIIAKRGDKIYLIDIDDIFYIRADLDEVIIKIKETDAYVRKKIGDLEKLLSNRNFFRVHRSYIVNVDRIKSMQSVEQSKLQISFDGIDEIVTSSKDGAKEFREYLERRLL
ncbi:MAG: LytR/AlgR family response regulator transcription factor [Campylobacterota bacterium]